jgi:hypothetical protein
VIQYSYTPAEGGSMKNSNIKLLISPKEYFRNIITKSAAKQNILLCEELEYYLVNLMCEFVEPHKLSGNESKLNFFETPLAFRLKEAIEAPPEKQFALYKSLGDTSLYMSGYFQDYFNSKTYDHNYYISMGAQAYSHIASISQTRHKDKDFCTLYKKLSEQFPDMVDIMSLISEQNKLSQNHVPIL